MKNLRKGVQDSPKHWLLMAYAGVNEAVNPTEEYRRK
jgi:hypothetical protein